MAPSLNQIQACLKCPEVWRFIGFASAVIGLLSYALSSSFNSLFGKWNLWKTFLYCVFSFIICTATLFAKVWQHSSSLQFEASIEALKEMNPKLLRRVHSYKYQNVGMFFQPDREVRNLFIDALPSEIINNLNQAMKLAVAAGFEEECCHLYSSCRKEFLQQCLSALNLQDFFINEYNNAGAATERLQSWIRASKIAVKIVFLNERRLCDRVFLGLSSVGDLSFVQICKDPSIRLLNFPKTFEAEPMICWELVEVLSTLANIVPELESFFPDQEAASLNIEAISTHERLSEAIRNIFKDTENLTRCDTRVPDVPGGIYPITDNIMDGISRVIEEAAAWKAYPMVSDGGGTSPSFHVEMAWIMEQLESYLESMSKNYTEPALCYVSMMNNFMYMKQKIISWQNEARRNRIYPFFTDDQIQKLTSEVQQNLEDYRRISWNEVLGLLRLDNEEESMAPGVAAESMKEKLELFNIQFEQICTIQSEWFASDDIRKDIIKALENMLLPAYGDFIRRFQDILCNCAYEYIQFGIFDIKARLNGTFLGGKREISGQKWRRKLLELV